MSTKAWTLVALVVASIAKAGSAEITPDAGTDTSLESFEGISDFQSVESEPLEPAEESFAIVASAYGKLELSVGVDTSFDQTTLPGLQENVGESLARARLGLDLRLSEKLRALVEARLRWKGATQAGWTRSKAYAEAEVGEAFLDVYSRAVDLRIGQQVTAFGANVAFAPTDILNPRDFRDSILLTEPEDAKLPVPAIRALTQVGRVSLTGVVVPFFVPSRYVLFGQDQALLQPALGRSFPSDRINPSIEDVLQPRLLETERPMAYPWLGDFGARATLDATRNVKVGLSWVSVNEKLPQVTIDPELQALLDAESRGDAIDPALALSLENRFRAGEQLLTGRYGRQQVFAAEASALIRATQLDVDFGYSPEQTFYDARLRFTRKSSFTWVVGATQAEDSRLRYALNYVGLAIPDVQAEELLFLLEPGTARGGSRTAFFHLLMGEVGYSLFEDRLLLSVRGGFEPIQRSFALAPEVTWMPRERLSLSLGAEFYEGRAFSPFGYFGRNDKVVATLALEL